MALISRVRRRLLLFIKFAAAAAVVNEFTLPPLTTASVCVCMSFHILHLPASNTQPPAAQLLTVR
jgi:hypothetical protein